MINIDRQGELKNIWNDFINERIENTDRLPSFILESWKRCKKLNVNPYQKAAPMVSPDLLEERKNNNRQLIEVANKTMEDTYNFIKGSEFMFGLFDKDGYALKILGDQEVIERTKAGNWQEGSCWNELGAGTNGVSLAIIEDRPLQVRGFEHYCRCSHYWACSAAPIHDLNGNLLGVLDLTGRYDLVNPHTLGIVVSAAKSIERMLALKNVLIKYQIANKYQNVCLDVIEECLLIIEPDGTINHINISAGNFFEIDSSKCIGMNLNAILPADNDSLYKIVYSKEDVTDNEISILLNNGNKIRCIISKRNVIIDNQKIGIVITFYKTTRIKKLARKFTSATKTFDDLIGSDIQFKQTIKLAKAGALGDANILILGESGTGKDMLAQAIHNASSFSDGPFVAINCAAIPHELIASELFGYADGVFTGAVKGGKPGKIELAEGGTLFLDEIGDMPLNLQTTLLRVIENKTFMRVGGDREIPVEERIIAATNKNLLYEISIGKFRADLYYRLNIVSIEMPALRGRPNEIKLLLEYFINKMAKKMGKPPLKISKQKFEKLMAYNWPGNVRELSNLVERSYYFDMDELILTESIAKSKNISPDKVSLNANNVESFERKLIEELLEQNNYTVTEVAKTMGQSRSTLYRKMRKYNIVAKYQ
ncbi:MAG: sigma 54-interacting transcriptional regulator [Syntrophomonadaceae bacterium]|nr:sigma 54-interacting transcriptional regulator [Syntrophomonadaceae bacterium]